MGRRSGLWGSKVQGSGFGVQGLEGYEQRVLEF